MKSIRKYFAAAILPLMVAMPAAADDSFCIPDTIENDVLPFNETAQFLADISMMINEKVTLDAYSIGPDAGKTPDVVSTGHTLLHAKMGNNEGFLMFNNETGMGCEVTAETYKNNRPVNAPEWGIK